jgi:hypothetical protein
MTEGWKCPGCDACYAPFVPKCDTCGPHVKITINPTIQMPECEHTWGSARTNGVFCTICGTQQMPAPPTTTTCGGRWTAKSVCQYCGAPDWGEHAFNCGRHYNDND